MSYQMILIAFFCSALANAAENPRTSQPDEPGVAVPGQVDAERMDRFVILNQKLKSAVCDESFISKAPTLESITDSSLRAPGPYYIWLPREVSEAEVLSFLLGDSLAGVYSEFVRTQLDQVLTQRGLKNARAEKFLEAQSVVMAVKRNVSLDVCEGLVQSARLKKLFGAHPSRFLEAMQTDHGGAKAGYRLELLDSGGRFGNVGERMSANSLDRRHTLKWFVPGWVEPFEVQRVSVLSAQGARVRAYRRISNPLTNNTQSIEVIDPSGVPLGVLYVSHEPTATEWSTYRDWSELPEARARQIETYRSRIEIDSVRFLETHPDAHDKVRNLQEFYKNLLQAYQLFPNEKQFDAYSKAGKGKAATSDGARAVLGPEFLRMMGQANVNGNHVHLGLFKPDAKLHAIYSEFAARLSKL